MSPSSRCAVAFVAAAALALIPSAVSAAALPTLAPPADPVAAPVSADPLGHVRGTLVMVHAGGWAGHDAAAQQQLMERPGSFFVQRGWRVVSIDYHEGTQGLQDVLDAAGGELVRRSSDGPLCVYGESAGAHLALVAAARLRAIDCVIGVGTPTDLPLYQSEAAGSPDQLVKLVASQATRFFGTTLPELARWSPVTLAPAIHADLMLLHERDDPMVSALHASRMQAARPTVEIVGLEPGDPSMPFIHGTVSTAGRAAYDAALGAFGDRAIGDRRSERAAARTRCVRVGRSLQDVGLRRLRDALRCLARRRPSKDRAQSARWRRTQISMRGEINAARIWARLRATKSGTRALSALASGRATVVVRTAQRSRVVLRSTKLGGTTR